MIGKFIVAFCVSSMSAVQRLCESTSSTLTAIILTFRLSNSPFIFAASPSSVVQTGVTSFGWEKRIAHLSPIQSWNLMRPVVVSASKSGATVPS